MDHNKRCQIESPLMKTTLGVSTREQKRQHYKTTSNPEAQKTANFTGADLLSGFLLGAVAERE